MDEWDDRGLRTGMETATSLVGIREKYSRQEPVFRSTAYNKPLTSALSW